MVIVLPILLAVASLLAAVYLGRSARRLWSLGPVCSRCGYPVSGLTSPTCPECGASVADGGVYGRDRTVAMLWLGRVVLVGVAVLSGGVGMILAWEHRPRLVEDDRVLTLERPDSGAYEEMHIVGHWRYWLSGARAITDLVPYPFTVRIMDAEGGGTDVLVIPAGADAGSMIFGWLRARYPEAGPQELRTEAETAARLIAGGLTSDHNALRAALGGDVRLYPFHPLELRWGGGREVSGPFYRVVGITAAITALIALLWCVIRREHARKSGTRAHAMKPLPSRPRCL